MTIRVLMLADDDFARRERQMLWRLRVGLADEGVRIIHAVPESRSATANDVSSTAVSYAPSGLPWGRRARARRLIDEIASKTDEPPAIDVVHAFGDSVWALAADVASQTRAALALEVWRPAHARALAEVQSLLGPEGRLVLVTPDPALRVEPPGPEVRCARWGVHTPGDPRSILIPGRSVSLILVGGAVDGAAYRAAVEGIAKAAREFPSMLIFADSDGASAAGAWQVVSRAHLSDRFTLVPGIEDHRDLALQGDLLVQPEAGGEHRSMTLDAMAAGVAVAGAADQQVGWLIEGRTARLVDRRTPERWGTVLVDMLRDAAGTRDLGRRGWEFVREHHRASTHLADVLDCYERLASKDQIPFRSPG